MKRTLLLAASAVVLTAPTIAQELPPGDPRPGECFARVIVPATYETTTEQIVTKPETTELRKIPARYETVPQRILVQEESYEMVPVGTGGYRYPSSVTIGGVLYAISSDGTVSVSGSGAGGAPIGNVNGNGDIVGANGSVIARGVAARTSSGSYPSAVSVGGVIHTIDSSGAVRRASSAAGGTIIGRVDSSGNVVSSGGAMLASRAVRISSTGSSTGQMSSTFRTVTETVVVQEASTELITIPAVYGTVSETVVVKPQSVEYVSIPAEYETYNETIVVQEASTELVTVPPVYDTVTETVVVKDAATELVTIPATY